MKTITPTTFFSMSTHIIISFLIGMFMLVNLFLVIEHVRDASSNYREYLSKDVVLTGRVHKFLGADFTTNKSGTVRNCFAAEANGHIVVRAGNNSQNEPDTSGFCQRLFEKNIVSNWEDYVPERKSSFIGTFFWTIVLLSIVGTAAYMIGQFPALLIVLAVPKMADWIRPLTIVFMIPFMIFWLAFISSGWQHHPSGWISPDGYVIKTTKAFFTSDGKAYTAPETLYDWSNSHTMHEISVLNPR